MGAGASTYSPSEPAITKNEIDASIPDALERELRSLMYNAVGIQRLYQFAHTVNSLYLLEIWDSFEEYKSLSVLSGDAVIAIADNLMQHLELFPMADDFQRSCKTITNNGYTVKDAQIHDMLIDKIQNCCLKHIYNLIFLPFMETPDYKFIHTY